MPEHSQGPIILNYVAGRDEIVRGRPYTCIVAAGGSVERWYMLTEAGEHFEISSEQVTGDSGEYSIELTKYDTLSLPAGHIWIYADDEPIHPYQVTSLAGLELRYWELADAMPDWKQPEFKAFSYALHQAIRQSLEWVDHSFVWADVDSLTEAVLDEMAVELRAPYYDSAFPIEQKREIVKKSLVWRQEAGTLAALNNMISTVYGYGEVVEWPDFGGDPYTFRFISEEPNQDPDFYQRFYELVRKVKNVRSHLAGVDFVRKENRNLYIGGAATEVETIDIISDEIPHIYKLTYGYHLGAAVEEIKLATIIYEDIEREPTSIIGNDLYTGGAVHAVTVTTITAA